MYSKEDFIINDAEQVLSVLKGKYKFPTLATQEEVNNILDKLLFDLNIYTEAPKYKISRTYYNNDSGNIVNAKVTVYVTPKYALFNSNIKASIELDAGVNFFNELIDNIAEWFDGYEHLRRLTTNLNEFNTIINGVIEEKNIPFNICFSLGEGLIDVSDKDAVIGLSQEVIMDLGELPLFDMDRDVRRTNYKNLITEVLLQCKMPYDIFKVKSVVTQEHLKIYTKTLVYKLMKKCVSKNVASVYTGEGYIETEDIFAIIDKKAVTKEELKSYNNVDHYALTNKKITAQDKRDGKDKMVLTYKVSPISKKDGTQVDLPIVALIATIK